MGFNLKKPAQSQQLQIGNIILITKSDAKSMRIIMDTVQKQHLFNLKAKLGVRSQFLIRFNPSVIKFGSYTKPCNYYA